MITRETKVSEVLARYPQSLDVFLGASAAFAKLKNPVMRKLLAPRVSIEQAAKMADLAPATLLTALNRACGLTDGPDEPATADAAVPTAAPASERPAILDKIGRDQLVLLDVREEIERNVDPFKKIMTTVKQLRDGQVLHLINVFEPVPLYDVLAHRGLGHWTEVINGVWHVYFFASADAASTATPASVGTVTAPSPGAPGQIVELDVSGLEPPEPMMKILATLPTLPAGASLVVHHHRAPKMLYPHLEERGYEWTTTQLAEDSYRIVIRNKGDA